MKVLIFNWQDIKNPLSGGAEVHLHEIFKRVADKGHEVTLYCCEFENCPKEEVIDGIRIIRNGARNTFNFGVRKAYKELTNSNQYDIIIDDINKIPFYTPIFVKKEPLMAISHHFFGKSIFRETNFFAGLYVYTSEKLIDFIYKNTQFVVVSESTMHEFWARGFPEENFTIVSNAITQEDFPMKVGKKDSKPNVTYFGRLKKYKSVDHLFHAFSKVVQQLPDAQLNIMGSGDFREYLVKLSVELNIEKNTTFHGFVSEDDKKILLSKAHCVVNTSMKEGWGITNIEANACGSLVISSDVPGLRDSVSDGESGLLYDYGDTDQLAEQLLKVLTDDKLRSDLSEGAVSWAKKFSWDDSANLMINAMEKIINSFK